MSVSYFFWDEDTSIRELKAILSGPDPWQRRYYAAKIMREARYEDVWRFLSLQEASRSWESLRPILGRRRGFWEFLFSVWKRHGLVSWGHPHPEERAQCRFHRTPSGVSSST